MKFSFPFYIIIKKLFLMIKIPWIKENLCKHRCNLTIKINYDQ